jgi:hypothetical protein
VLGKEGEKARASLTEHACLKKMIITIAKTYENSFITIMLFLSLVIILHFLISIRPV